jgi:hypothetical protein
VKWHYKNRAASPASLGPPRRVGGYARQARLTTRLLAGYFLITLATAWPIRAQTPCNAITTVAGGPQDASGATLSLPTSVIGDLAGKHYEPGVPALMRTAPADF